MKLRTVSWLLIGAVFASLVVPAAAAQANTNRVVGSVTTGGVPVAGISVGWVSDGSDYLQESAVSGADGSYVLHPPVDESYFLAVNFKSGLRAPGNVAFNAEYLGSGGGRDYVYQTLTAYQPASVPETAIELTKSGSISGRYASAYVGGTMSLRSLAGNSTRAVVPNVGRTFSFTGLIPGRYELQGVPSRFAGQLAPYTSPPITVNAGGATRADVVPNPGGTISGIVTVAGKPKSGSTVMIDGGGSTTGVTTDSRGSYHLSGLQPGDYVVSFGQFSPRGQVAAPVPQKKSVSHLAAGARATVSANLALGGRIVGKISGSGIAATSTIIVTQNGVRLYELTSANSSFVVGGLATGTYTVYFRDRNKSKYATKTVSVKAGRPTPVGTVVLATRTIAMSGKISSPGPATVSVESAATSRRTVTETNTGGYSVLGLIPGVYVVTVSSGKTADNTYRNVRLRSSVRVDLAFGKAVGSVSASFVKNGNVLRFATAEVTTVTPGGTFPQPTLSLLSQDSPLMLSAGDWHITELFTDGPYPFFQLWAPYKYRVPSAVSSFSVASGKNTPLGAIEVELGE